MKISVLIFTRNHNASSTFEVVWNRSFVDYFHLFPVLVRYKEGKGFIFIINLIGEFNVQRQVVNKNKQKQSRMRPETRR